MFNLTRFIDVCSVHAPNANDVNDCEKHTGLIESMCVYIVLPHGVKNDAANNGAVIVSKID